MKKIIFTLFVMGSLTAVAQIPTKVEPFNIKDVRLTESAFKHAQELDISYLLGLNADRLLAPYMKEAGLTPKAPNYTNWENTGLDGHIGGHYLSALSYMYAATGNAQIKERLDYTLSELKRAQDAAGDGYLSGVPDGRKIWNEIHDGNIRAASFGLNDRWVPLYNIDKIYSGLRDAYVIAGKEEAKQMLVALTDWMIKITENLTEAQMQDMLRSEHGGLNERFAEVAAITSDIKYLELAKRFSHQLVLKPLIEGRDALTGMHANTQIPKVIGFKRIADLEGNTEWDKASAYFWDTVVKHRSITIGGNSVYEHFHPAEDFSSMLNSEQGPETCNTYNMLRLTKMLYATTSNASYMDFYEQALYNHILSTINPVQGGFVYFTPMRAGHYRVYSQPQTSFWCCVGSGLENHARYGEMIYAHKDNNLFVNLFIPSTISWNGTTIEQKNNFPYEDFTTLTVTPGKESKFNIKVRKPEWTSSPKVEVNGQIVNATIKDGYINIERKWEEGDVIKVTLPMSLKKVPTPDGANHYSFMYGPIVLAANIGKDEQSGMYADDSRGGHIAHGRKIPATEMPTLIAENYKLTKKEGVNGLKFALTGAMPEKYKEIELVPFNELYECRYMVYFPIVSAEEYATQQKLLAEQEAKRIALDNVTIDKVICGEQQPESDHFIDSKLSTTGDINGRHWRETKNYVTYTMKSNGAKAILVTYIPNKERNAKVLINGKEIGKIESSENGNEAVARIECNSTEPTFKVTIAKDSSDTTPRIFEVRIVNK
jgi:DUF1680 family protein